MTTTKIPISCSKGTGFIWDINDVKELRIKYNICGVLTGTLPQLSQQNVFLGLPLQLLPEEVVSLVEKGICILIDDSHVHKEPTSETVKDFEMKRQKNITKQLRESEQRRKEAEKSLNHTISDKAKRVRQEREQKRKNENNSSLPENTSNNNNKEEETSYQIQIPTSSKHQVNYNPDGYKYETIEEARQAGVWTYPKNELEKAQCSVFKELWSRGYFLGPGIKFGADYLAYPGDPLRYHSLHSVTVVPSRQSQLSMIELVSWGRLATTVKKSHIIAVWDSQNDSVQFMSLQWAGF